MDVNIDPIAKRGMRIRLIKMDDDMPVDEDMEGTINTIDSLGTLHVNWDDGRTLGVIPGLDEYQLLPPEDEQVPLDVFEADDLSTKYNREFKSTISTVRPKIKLEADKVKGGIADKLTVQDIAKKHKVPIGDIRKEIKKGIPVELEHTKDRTLAKEIVMDHLTEFPDFYTNEKHGALASEKGLEKIHENTTDEFKVALKRIVDTIKTANFQHKDTVETMIDNFYHKYKGNVEDKDKFDEIYTNLKEKLHNKFEISDEYAGAYSGPLFGTLKKENRVFKVSDMISEVSRVNRLRDDGSFDGNSWVGEKDNDGWNFNDIPAWEGGEIVDILAKLDINWKDKDLTVTTNESFQKAVKGIVSEGWLIKTKEDKVAIGILKRVKEIFPDDAIIKYDYVRFSLPGVERRPRIDVKYKDSGTYLTVNDRELEASKWIIRKIYTYMVNIIEHEKETRDFRRIQADLTDPNFAQDAFDQMNEGKDQIIKDLNLDGFNKISEEEEELDEESTFGSVLGNSGTYVSPAFAAPDGKHAPSKKPIWKGGKIVQNIKSDGVLVAEMSQSLNITEVNTIVWSKSELTKAVYQDGKPLFSKPKVFTSLEDLTTDINHYKNNDIYNDYKLVITETHSDGMSTGSSDKHSPISNELTDLYYQLKEGGLKPKFTHKKDALKILSKKIEISYDTNAGLYNVINSSTGEKYYNTIQYTQCKDCEFHDSKYVIQFVREVPTSLKEEYGRNYRIDDIYEIIYDELINIPSKIGRGTVVDDFKMLMKSPIGGVENFMLPHNTSETGTSAGLSYDYDNGKVMQQGPHGMLAMMIFPKLKEMGIIKGKLADPNELAILNKVGLLFYRDLRPQLSNDSDLGGRDFYDLDDDGNPITEVNDVKWVKGGKYVKIKDKCSKFNNQPWCNSGNASDPLELSDSTFDIVEGLSKKLGIPKETILKKIKSSINPSH